MQDTETKLRVALEKYEAGEGTMDDLVKYILELTAPTPIAPEHDAPTHSEAELVG